MGERCSSEFVFVPDEDFVVEADAGFISLLPVLSEDE